MLHSKQARGLHRPVCEALGTALLEQQLHLAAQEASAVERNDSGDRCGPANRTRALRAWLLCIAAVLSCCA